MSVELMLSFCSYAVAAMRLMVATATHDALGVLAAVAWARIGTCWLRLARG